VVCQVRAGIACRLRHQRKRAADKWHLDEVFLTINGRRQYLWRAVDQDGNVLDILVQPRRDAKAAKRFFRKLPKRQCASPVSSRANLDLFRVNQRGDGVDTGLLPTKFNFLDADKDRTGFRPDAAAAAHGRGFATSNQV
jgi:hypothetical protein